MENIRQLFSSLGVNIPEIMIPDKNINMSSWSVVACDQYTSQPEYWSQVEKYADGKPSTLNLILPEAFLDDVDLGESLNKINTTMEKYLKDQILVPQKPGFIYVERRLPHQAIRKGLVMAVDLEKYDYSKGSQALIRATEGTVIERLPPRVEIRQNASIELPHIMLLIDDPNKTVIEPLCEMAAAQEPLYDFPLMMGGGHIKGYMINDQKIMSGIAHALEKLAQPDSFINKYGLDEKEGVLLFAVGDGNHSLAAAKALWDKVKSSLSNEERAVHPGRYALVEVVNVHDDGLVFEPIHRVLFNANPVEIQTALLDYFGHDNNILLKSFKSLDELEKEAEAMECSPDCHAIPMVSMDRYDLIIIKNPLYNLHVGTLQAFLDHLIQENPEIKIDYIHGKQATMSLGTIKGNIGFILPPMNKHDLFKTVILDGVLPRKTFSMGEADEKRYYLECRKIK